MRAIGDADLVLLGADAIGPLVANKIGSRAVALLAADLGVRCYAFADRSKSLPSSIVSRAVPPYESFPAGSLTAVITEDGPLRAGDLRRIEQKEVPRALWRAAGFSGVPTEPGSPSSSRRAGPRRR